MLRIANCEGRNLEQALLEFVIAYKSTPHGATCMTPYAIMLGREMRTKLPMLSNEVAKTAEEAGYSDALNKRKMKDQTDVGSKDSPIGRGDSVPLRRETRSKLDTMYHPEPYRVAGCSGYRYDLGLLVMWLGAMSLLLIRLFSIRITPLLPFRKVQCGDNIDRYQQVWTGIIIMIMPQTETEDFRVGRFLCDFTI